MATIVQYDTAGRVTQHLPSVNTPDFQGKDNTLINPDLSGVKDVPVRDWIVDIENVRSMTRDEKDRRDVAELAIRDEQANALQFDADLAIKAIINIMSSENRQAVIGKYKQFIRA